MLLVNISPVRHISYYQICTGYLNNLYLNLKIGLIGKKLIRTVYLTPATILSSLDIIKEQIPNSSDLKSAFESALFRITDPEYEEIKLYVDVNSSI